MLFVWLLDSFLPDLDPLNGGLTGAYAFAAHRGETLDDLIRRGQAASYFFAWGDSPRCKAFLDSIGATRVRSPRPQFEPGVLTLEMPPKVEGTVFAETRQFTVTRLSGRRTGYRARAAAGSIRWDSVVPSRHTHR
jgi:hypothetical protein